MPPRPLLKSSRQHDRSYAFSRLRVMLSGMPALLIVADISPGGFSLACNYAELVRLKALKMPTQATIVFQGIIVGCTASIINCVALGGDTHRVGFKIERIAPEDAQMLASITAKLQALT